MRSFHLLRSRRAACAVLLFALALPHAALAAEGKPAPSERETWWVLSLNGQPVGFLHERTRQEGEGVAVSSDFQLVLNRMGNRVEMSYAAATLESAEGALSTLDYDLKLSQQTTRLHAEAGDGVLRLSDRAGVGGGSYERTLPYTGELAGPERLRRLSAERLRADGDRLDLQIFSPEMGQVVTLSRRVLGLEPAPGAEGSIPTVKVEESLSGLPLKRTLWLKLDGEILRSEDPSPFGPLVATLGSREAAERAGEGGELPAEVFAATLVRTQVRLPEPRRLERLTLELRHRHPELGWPDLAGPGQRVIERTAQTLTLEIVRQHAEGAHPFPVAATPETAEHLEPNALIQSNDSELQVAARRIVAGEIDALRAGLALQRWVAKNLTFDLGVVMAPSSEVFRNRRGTCASYATLLTALLRAVGIPARYVLGYVYVDGILGGHAWSEILLGDRWVPIDGALPSDGPADAGHLALQHLTLRDGAGGLNSGPALQLFGQIDARVLSFQVEGGELRQVDGETQPYAVSGDLYRNPGLGLELTRPDGFTFTDLDGVWPEETLLALTTPGGARVELERLSLRPWEEPEAALQAALGRKVPIGERREMGISGAGGPVHALVTKSRAVAAFTVGDDAWLLCAEGEGAEELLGQVARRMRWRGRR